MALISWRPDGFLIAIGAVVAAAALFPQLGARGGLLHIDVLTGFAIALIFFLHGAILPLEALRRGVRNIRLHLVAQGVTFLLFPAIGTLIFALGGGWFPSSIALGFFFMSTVSSTISSSVALTAVAGGDVAGALFNATLSGILGVLVTPAYASLMAHSIGVALSLPEVIHSVAVKILLPLILGQLFRPTLWKFLERHRAGVQLADRSSIILIVYGAFCESVATGVWNRAAALPAVISVVVAAAALVLVSLVLVTLTRALRMDRASAIAAYFCGSQKSLANGLPTAHAIFAGSPAIGLIVMPLLVYHQLQLAAGAVIARRLGQRITA